MADKARFFREAHRVLRAGGRLCVFAWLAPERRPSLGGPAPARADLPGGAAARHRRRRRTIAASRRTQASGSPRLDDISGGVRRTWTVCARRLAGLATDPAYRRYLLDGRSRNRAFALSLARLAAAYRTGALRYGVLVADKPP